jgi:hypothetical protein
VRDAWGRHWGTPDELALVASSWGEARNLNLLARSTLRTAGGLAGPSVTAGSLELTPGARVVPRTESAPLIKSVKPAAKIVTEMATEAATLLAGR